MGTNYNEEMTKQLNSIILNAQKGCRNQNSGVKGKIDMPVDYSTSDTNVFYSGNDEYPDFIRTDDELTEDELKEYKVFVQRLEDNIKSGNLSVYIDTVDETIAERVVNAADVNNPEHCKILDRYIDNNVACLAIVNKGYRVDALVNNDNAFIRELARAKVRASYEQNKPCSKSEIEKE